MSRERRNPQLRVCESPQATGGYPGKESITMLLECRRKAWGLGY